ncbi:MAG: DDE-type integrase/transposase/recombinase [Gloeocapsa sp. UFS-A4-WI-NPMV-4B04]|nr:DDE-type integrase/transposase/recombinase [Gloeocapsa sp. UFS-A4-WI-NPMV-4B04]
MQKYILELDKRCRSHLQLTNDSWRVDENYIKVKGKDRYLYRTVDSEGNTLDFLLVLKKFLQHNPYFLDSGDQL